MAKVNYRKKIRTIQVIAGMYFFMCFVTAIIALVSHGLTQRLLVVIDGGVAFIMAIYITIGRVLPEDEDFYLNYSDLIELKNKLEKDHKKLDEVIYVVGKHESVKLWEQEKSNKEQKVKECDATESDSSKKVEDKKIKIQ